jgi:hypothetical protein
MEDSKDACSCAGTNHIIKARRDRDQDEELNTAMSDIYLLQYLIFNNFILGDKRFLEVSVGIINQYRYCFHKPYFQERRGM